ncbi:MAG TPA: VanZ family protein [Candidatus Limnocylindrales bacterium]|nr:VanZ family protein [Candidatus Limnocylindrales bacterium]
MRADLPRFRMNRTEPERTVTPSRASLFLRYWLPVLLYIGLIFGASSIPGRDIPNLFPYMDKLEHLTEYSLFGLLLGRAFRFTVGGDRGRFWSLATVAFGGFVGGMDELYQRLTPGRSSDIRDWAVDVTAVTLAVLFTQYVRIHPRSRRREPTPTPTPEKGTP